MVCGGSRRRGGRRYHGAAGPVARPTTPYNEPPMTAATVPPPSQPPAPPAFSKGLEGVIAAETHMSFIDGTKGILEYVGIAIDDLARHSTFEETVFLLWNRRLPTKAELDAFTQELRASYELPPN